MEKITCQLLGKNKTRLDHQPYPGELGKSIQNSFSTEAWHLWLDKQTMLINENHLNPLDPESRNLLEKEMRAFFGL